MIHKLSSKWKISNSVLRLSSTLILYRTDFLVLKNRYCDVIICCIFVRITDDYLYLPPRNHQYSIGNRFSENFKRSAVHNRLYQKTMKTIYKYT